MYHLFRAAFPLDSILEFIQHKRLHALHHQLAATTPPRPAPRPAPADKQAAPTTPSRRKQGAVRMKRKLEVEQEFLNRKGEKRKKEDIP